MPRGVRNAVATAATIWLLVLPGGASAGEPPNQNDPCSSGGRNTCGSNGTGFYDTYRYGLRWFGDFRGVVPNESHTYCIDLRYWYPAARHRFREDTSATLRNRDGETVSLENRRRIAYAIWEHGRTANANQAAAVMLYVHSLMGDARPGEADPSELNAAVQSTFARVTRDAARYHGPYRVALRLPGSLQVGQKGTATVRVLAASGQALPNFELALEASGASGVPGTVRTNDDGVGSVTFTATSADDVRLTARARGLASTLPRIFRPTTRAAAPNGQRLAIPDSQTVSATRGTAVSKARVVVSSVADPAELLAGAESRDRVTIRGAAPSFRVTVAARLHGPFRTAASIRCDQTPAWEGTWRTDGPGDYQTPPVKLDKPGWYVYTHVVPGDDDHTGVSTPCTDPRERVKVEVQPRVRTVVSSQRSAPGAEIFDRVIVEGLAGETATVQAALYGPFASREAIVCTGTPVWSGTVEARGDGEYQTAPVRLTVPGFYTYRETIAESELVRAAETRCGEEAETTIVPGAPQVRTQVSDAQTEPGARLSDRLVVTGLGALTATVKVDLFGPFRTRAGISCEGTPFWTGNVTAAGDGTYNTQPVTIDRVGYYTYRESIAETPQYPAFVGKCGETAETTFTRATPKVTTVVSNEVVAPGFRIYDTVRVEGLGKTEARIGVELFGPFATREAIRCTGEPYWDGEVFAQGDGTLRTPLVELRRAGFYTYREHLIGSELVADTRTACGEVTETALARPLILTGRNERVVQVRAAAAGPLAPARVQMAARGIDAPAFAVGIDVRGGALAAPANIQRLGWWLDGADLGSPTGSVLIAGHVDSARSGPGAFFRLREARRGDRIQVTARNGRAFGYRVTSVQTYLKNRLPTNIYSRAGRHRLVLVTCGGPFVEAEGQYRDNVVVTAVRG